MTTDDIMLLCDQVRDTAYAIHVYHGNGYLEKVYENALVNRLRKAGVSVKQQYPSLFKMKMALSLASTSPMS